MSEALIGFNFHFLLFAMAATGAVILAVIIDRTTPAASPSKAAWDTVINAALGFGLLEVCYWALRFLATMFVNS